MKSPLGSMTAAESDRAERLKRDCGCMACRQLNYKRLSDLHHILVGGRRVSHSFSIPLCEWHHRAIPMHGLDEYQTKKLLGPSMAREKRAFVDEFGSERELHAQAEQWLQDNPRVIAGRQ